MTPMTLSRSRRGIEASGENLAQTIIEHFYQVFVQFHEIASKFVKSD